MNKHWGKKIEGLATVIAVINAIISVGLGFGVNGIIAGLSRNNDSAPFWGIGVTCIGFFFSWVAYVFVSAYGAITTNAELQTQALYQTTPTPTHHSPTYPISEDDQDLIICPCCHSPNHADATECFNCKIFFVKS